jgi:hypothetical protein
MSGTKKTWTRRVAIFVLACVSVMNIPTGGFAQQPAAKPSTAPVQSQVNQKTALQQIAAEWSLPETALYQSTQPNPASPGSSDVAAPANQNQLAAAKEQKRGVSKKFIALGVLGAVVAVGGVVAMNEAKHNSNCATGTAAATAQQVCGDVHTAGKIMLPVGAGVAALGFFFGLRHAF